MGGVPGKRGLSLWWGWQAAEDGLSGTTMFRGQNLLDEVGRG